MRRTALLKPHPYFCPKCLRHYDPPLKTQVCTACEEQLAPIVDPAGALTREYLLAKGKCCENICRNCPWGFFPKFDD